METGFSFGGVIWGLLEEKLSFEAMYLCFPESLPIFVYKR